MWAGGFWEAASWPQRADSSSWRRQRRLHRGRRKEREAAVALQHRPELEGGSNDLHRGRQPVHWYGRWIHHSRVQLEVTENSCHGRARGGMDWETRGRNAPTNGVMAA